jgi:hypothetical protein
VNRSRQDALIIVHLLAGVVALALAFYYLLSATLSFELPAPVLAQRPRSVVVACFVGAAFFMFRGARRADLRGAAALGYACMALGLAVVWLIFYGSV